MRLKEKISEGKSLSFRIEKSLAGRIAAYGLASSLTFGSVSTYLIGCGDNADEPMQDTKPPVIINLRTVDINHNSANIHCDTDEAAICEVQYGETTSYGNSKEDTDYTQDHILNLTSLSELTEYYYRVMCSDEAGNESDWISDTFTTTQIPDTSPPVISHTPETEAWTSISKTITANVTDDKNLESVILYYKVGDGSEYSTAMLSNGTYTGTILGVGVDSAFLANPADYIDYKIVASDGTNETSEPESGYHRMTLNAIEGDGRRAIEYVVNENIASGNITPWNTGDIPWIPEGFHWDVSANLNDEPYGSYAAVVDYMDFWGGSPYFGFEYLYGNDIEPDGTSISEPGYNPDEIVYIENYLMTSPPHSAGPWLIYKGTISQI